MRKLASIQKIKKLNPLPQFDNLLLAEILGWRCIVKKGEFREGDFCIYFEIDSLLPPRPEYEFMEKYKYRVKTLKIRGVYSQGLALPAGLLIKEDVFEGQDVTDLLGIRKYEPPEDLKMGGDAKGNIPSFLIKTDEPRLQTVPAILERHRGRSFYFSEKLDGTSFTCYLKDGEFGVCSRNLELREAKENLYWNIARKYDLENKLKTLEGNYAIQGEIIGAGMQKNKYGLKDKKLYVFSIFNIDKFQYLSFHDFIDTCRKLDLEAVPILDMSEKLAEKNELTVDDYVEFSKGFSTLAQVPREGIVVRAKEETMDEETGRLSFKVINPEFLVKFG